MIMSPPSAVCSTFNACTREEINCLCYTSIGDSIMYSLDQTITRTLTRASHMSYRSLKLTKICKFVIDHSTLRKNFKIKDIILHQSYQEMDYNIVNSNTFHNLGYITKNFSIDHIRRYIRLFTIIVGY